MIRTETCLIVICDRCHTPAGNQDEDFEGEVHFRSFNEAAEQLPEWRLDLARGHAVCDTCVVDEECATCGHDFGEWRNCRCRGAIAAHMTEVTVGAILAHTCPVEIRWCQRCSWTGGEMRPSTTTREA
jgi:hypothetical protein